MGIRVNIWGIPDKMLPSIQDPAILAALVTLLAGGIGYLFREWQTRARPFTSVISVEGNFRRGGTVVAIPEVIVRALQNGHYLTKLGEQDTLDNVHTCVNEAKEILSSADTFLLRCDRVIEMAEQGGFMSAEVRLPCTDREVGRENDASSDHGRRRLCRVATDQLVGNRR